MRARLFYIVPRRPDPGGLAVDPGGRAGMVPRPDPGGLAVDPGGRAGILPRRPDKKTLCNTNKNPPIIY